MAFGTATVGFRRLRRAIRRSTSSVDEAGTFDASTSGNMVISATFPVISLANGDSVAFTFKLQAA